MTLDLDAWATFGLDDSGPVHLTGAVLIAACEALLSGWAGQFEHHVVGALLYSRPDAVLEGIRAGLAAAARHPPVGHR